MQVQSGSPVRTVTVERIERSHSERFTDTVAVEEPLEIRLHYWIKDVQVIENVAVTMRTPGHDWELAAGFLYSEGIIKNSSDINSVRMLGAPPSNEILVELSRKADLEIWRSSRATFVNSSCGICGKRSVDAIQTVSRIDCADPLSVDPALIHELPTLLSDAQEAFTLTGGLHAAALVDIAEGPRIEAVFEDIGRHNALDKLIGSCLRADNVPIHRRLLFLSSRSSFELVQKATAAGAPVLATIGGPSSLAIDSARRCGLTLIGFVRNGRFNVYSGEWRINS
jgi:FdhD protein